MNNRPESDANSEDLRPSAALIAAAQSKKGAESFYDKEKDLYCSIDESKTEKTLSSNTPIEPSANSATQPVVGDIYAKYRVKRPTLEKDEVAPQLLYDAKDDVFYFKADKKKNRTKAINTTSKNQHGFFNNAANPNQGLSEEELEHRINTCGIRGNQPTEKFVYSEKLGPSAELVKKAKERREKECALHKKRGIFGRTYYKRNENPSDMGCQLYWLRNRSDLPNHPFDDAAYLFDEQKNKLFYGKRGHFEEVNIADMTKFKEAFMAMMNTKQCRYDHKHISYDEIHSLITLNGGHTPGKDLSSVAASSNESEDHNKVENNEIKNKFSY